MEPLWEIASRLNLPVFPCNSQKKPTCTNGFKDAQTDRNRIRDLFMSSSSATLIGFATGAICGIDVLDIDSKREPETTATWLRKNPLPVTRKHQTMSGGFHCLFRHKEGLRCWNNTPTMGVDGRCDGGYAIYWPAKGYAVQDAPIIEWPARLLEQFQKQPRKIDHQEIPPIDEIRFAGVVRRVLNSVNGERNNVLFWASCRVGEWVQQGDMGRGEGSNILLHAALRVGLDEASASRTIHSGMERATCLRE